MGQAKSRGSLETRIESAVKAKDPRLEKLRADLGLPARISFGGYLVKVDDKDEFLGEISNGVHGFVASPEQALRFETYEEANDQARTEQNEVIVARFEFGEKIIVAHVS